jgi:SPP1 family predicted phage head-tail adaptor
MITDKQYTGQKDEVIVIQSATEAASAEGEPVKTWTNFLTGVWAHVVSMDGGEFIGMDKVNTNASRIFVINFRRTVTVLMRVVYRSQNYNILDVQQDDKRKDTFLVCSKVD